MKIVKGQKYLCVEDYYQHDLNGMRTSTILFNKGKVYKCDIDGQLSANIGTVITKDHSKFQPLSFADGENSFSAKWAIKRTPENAEVVNIWANKESNTNDYTAKSGYIHSKSINRGLLALSNNNIKNGYTEIDFETFKEIIGMGEEKPNQLLGEKEAVHCPTLELAEKVIEIFKENGSKPIHKVEYYWQEYLDNLCFTFIDHSFGYSSRKFYVEIDFDIIPAEQFIEKYEATQQKIFTIEDVRNGKCAIENDGTDDVDLKYESKSLTINTIREGEDKYLLITTQSFSLKIKTL